MNSWFLHRCINTEIDTEINVGVYMRAYIHIFPNGPLREPRSNETPIAMSKPSAQILISKYHFLIKEPEFLGEMVDSRAGSRKIQDEPGASCGTRK